MPPETSAELERIARCLATQDNRATHEPIFIVQRKVREFGWDPDYCEARAFVSHEHDPPVLAAEEPERFARFQAGQFDPDVDGDEDFWTLTGYRDRWEFVQPFFTLEAAEAYRASQAHNLGESRVYVGSAYRNHEWAFLRALLMSGALTP